MHWNPAPQNWIDYVQWTGWVILAPALPMFARRIVMEIRAAKAGRDIGIIAAFALIARLLVPWLPFDWYSGVDNVNLGAPIWSKHTTYMPLPNQFFTFKFGFHGILAFNIALGVLCSVLVWLAAWKAGHDGRTSFLLGVLLAITPMYVRLSASDDTHFLPLFLWLIAILAAQRIGTDQADYWDHLVLFAATLVVCPIRLEAGLVFPSIFLFAERDITGWKRLWAIRRRFRSFGAAYPIGMATAASFHSASWHLRLLDHGFNPIQFLALMAARVLLLVSPLPDGFLPALLIIPAYCYCWSQWRSSRVEFLSAWAPFAILSIPFAASGEAIFMELPSSAYNIIPCVFLLLLIANGMAMLYERHSRVALGGAALCLAMFLVPYQALYAYMNEFSFLERRLPREKATVLAIWDPDVPGGDYDCCLALPYPTFAHDMPDLKWIVLSRKDARQERIRGLHFDYYYPGLLTAIDLPNVDRQLLGRMFPDPAMTEKHRATLLEIRALDSLVRSTWNLAPERAEDLGAETFSWAPFAGSRMHLTIYRNLGLR